MSIYFQVMKSSLFKRTAKVLGTWKGVSRSTVTVSAEPSTAQGCPGLMKWDGGELARGEGEGEEKTVISDHRDLGCY